MNISPTPSKGRGRAAHTGGIALALAATLAAVTQTHAAVTDGLTDLAPVPLITSSPQVVKPNLMFIFDDSGSMGWSYMPDTVEDFGRTSTGSKRVGFPSSQCNGVYYNPTRIYTPPSYMDASGTVISYGNQSFTSAKVNGFDSSSSTVDLSTSFRAWSDSTVQNNSTLDGNADTAQAAYYYTYSGTENTAAKRTYLDTSSTFYTECRSLDGATGSKFTKVTVSDISGSASGPVGADERTNFANWYSYYRTRMLMMKTATGRAFLGIDSTFRVGYMSINNNVSPSFLNISDFTGQQKADWYTKLYGATPNNSTPLREALSNAGRIYAGQLSSLYTAAVTDPVQYSCQKNFALLSTDGYWNGNAGFQADGSTAVGNQDSSEPRPYNDGGSIGNVYTTTLTVSSSNSSGSVTSITINGVNILSGSVDSSGGSGTRSEKLARNITNAIANGYTATRSGTTVTVSKASATAITGSPAIVTTGSASVTATAVASSGSTSVGGNSDTLADVAQYYYKTDLRTSGTLAVNNVLPGGDDDATWQHMSTYTLGLGAPGRMTYVSNYKTDSTGHYAAIKDGSAASSTTCPWQSAGTCTWPTPSSGNPENIDDLWHAAVNGRGTYFSAGDAGALAVGLVSALQNITAVTSDSAAASTSNPNITAGDNFIFSSTFRSAEWYGELERRQINPTTGVIAAAADWTAAGQLDAKAYATRAIYTFDSTATNKRKLFTWANLDSAEQDNFKFPHINSLSQFCASGDTCVTSGVKSAAHELQLVDFIRGDRSNEGAANETAKAFRQRAHVLGDIVNSEAVYVNRPQFDYVDSGYGTFKTTGIATTRAAMVYVGANDGMLHAFNATTGAEAWAYVPKLLMPTLYKLADKFYATKHNYYVDGSPTISDAYFGGAWHTVLVGGFNGGGRGYYAIDITDPTDPKPLWEFTDANMGYSFGRPEITKVGNTWVAMFTSGYNNVNPGDGKGYLYVVNLETGLSLPNTPISTYVGSDTAAITGVCATAPCPSGLAQIRAYVDNARYNNTTTKVYGGDLFGNVWRFDVNDTIAPTGLEAQQLADLRGPGGAVQSITARPELGLVAGYPVVYVGTGRYLGVKDFNDTSVQSMYAIKDAGTATSYGNPRSDLTAAGFVQQTMTAGICGTSDFCTAGTKIRTGSGYAVNFSTQRGWFVDLPGTGERANTDPQLALGTLAFTTNVLDPTACSVGGSSFINYLDYKTGAPVSTASGLVSVYLDNSLATRTVQVKLQDGSVRSLVRLSDNTNVITPTPVNNSAGGTRRTSWRELIQ